MPSLTPTTKPTIAPQQNNKTITNNKQKHRKHWKKKQKTQSIIDAIQSIQSWQYITDITSNTTDIMKYNKTRHKLCDTYFYTRAMVGAHHKVFYIFS